MMSEAQYGQQIRRVRKAFHLTQQEMAQRAGISINSLRRYESNERQPNMAIIDKLAMAVNLPTSKFLWYDPTSEGQDFEAFDGYFQEMGYSVKLDLARFDNPKGKNGPVWVIHDKRNDIRYSATTEQLNNLMDNIISYTKFQIHELLVTLDQIPEYQKKDEPSKE